MAQSVTLHFRINQRGIDPYKACIMGKAADDTSRRAETKPPGGGSKIYKILGVVTDVSGEERAVRGGGSRRE
jgi:hypothetical protein